MRYANLDPKWLLTARRGSRKAALELVEHPNVLYVTIGEKRRRGEATGKTAVVAYVLEKGGLPKSLHIPKSVQIGGMANLSNLPTDVVQLPSMPRVLGARAGNILSSPDGDFGTACFSFTRNGKNYIATCAHVVGNVTQRKVPPGAIGVQEPSSRRYFPAGALQYISTFPAGGRTDEDLAIFSAGSIPVDHMAIYNENFPIKAFGEFRSNLKGQFWYSSNGVRIYCSHPEPVPIDVDVPITVDQGTYYYRNFWKLWVDQGIPADGHSGSVLCYGEGSNIYACGILFGGAPPSYAYVYPLQPRLRQAIASSGI